LVMGRSFRGGKARGVEPEKMTDVIAVSGRAMPRARRTHLSRAESVLRWLLRFLLPLEIALGALLIYWVCVDDDSALILWKLIGAVPLTITCAAVALWAWEVWQPDRVLEG
jgi:hypothetical protein